MSGGRSRLHLIDLGSCEKVLSKSRDGGGGLCLSLTALGNVILALTNGAKHVPYRYESADFFSPPTFKMSKHSLSLGSHTHIFICSFSCELTQDR